MWLTIIGLVITLIGAGFGVIGVRVTEDQAIERGVSQWSGGTRDEKLKLPAVRNLLRQSHFAVWGFILIGLGTILQIVAVVIDKI